ncbi:hypothetical protein LSUB1_G007195 [Lachnellula subtilissima]|uniref:Uncharacterized protein n=1 Tax=Lachnellula subtilissima TaxID=602034 RepID=A0A8H8U5A9_9HELO|nr:hypothetical protein LSUB1_G007195 [Lachnellula subtilissima]
MTSKLIPQHPDDVMVIRDLVPGVTTLSVPFLRFGRIKFGGRATIVKMQSGSLAVFSPVALTPTSPTSPRPTWNTTSSSQPGRPPSPPPTSSRPKGWPRKRAKINETDKEVTIVPINTTFTAKNKAAIKVDAEFDAEFEYEFVDAHPNKELVFCHKPSRTLIEADLLFTLPATEQYSRTGENAATGLATKCFAGIQNTRGEALGQKRMLWYVFSKADRPGFNDSMRRIDAWRFENLVPCHGDSIVGDGKRVFLKRLCNGIWRG